ncbi:MAG: hypothetical protein FJ403_08335 [Verrucomicrobia bacterium]|nr:hypothetical protein [Verrucomicrobiota bacterium]
MDQFAQLGSPAFYGLFALLVLARGLDFFSTWMMSPNLDLEANPISRRMGWKIAIPVNLILCFGFALWPLPAVVISTSSVLVAARNLQSVWLVRTLGQERYRLWFVERVREMDAGLYVFCLLAQGALIGSVGAALMFFSHWRHVSFAIGMGIITYAVALVVYTLLSVRQIRRPF